MLESQTKRMGLQNDIDDEQNSKTNKTSESENLSNLLFIREISKQQVTVPDCLDFVVYFMKRKGTMNVKRVY